MLSLLVAGSVVTLSCNALNDVRQRMEESTVEARENTAVSVLRIINTGQVLYLLDNGSYAESLSQLVDAGHVPSEYATGRSGYVYEIQGEALNYSVTATPDDRSGRYFYSGPDGVVRYETGAPATSDSLPVPDRER